MQHTIYHTNRMQNTNQTAKAGTAPARTAGVRRGLSKAYGAVRAAALWVAGPEQTPLSSTSASSAWLMP